MNGFGTIVYRSHRRRKRRLKKWFMRKFRSRAICLHCNTPHSKDSYIEYHHVDKKTKVASISKMLSDNRSKTTILRELAKCIPLCTKCHREEEGR